MLLNPVLLSAKEVTVLNSYISGEVPQILGTKELASQEISRLSRHYLRRNFYTDITEGGIVEKFLIKENFTIQSRLSPDQFDRFCLEFESNFVSYDIVDFGQPTLIETQIYNCRTKQYKSINSKLNTNFLLSIEKHVEKCFRFLSPKYYQTRGSETDKVSEIHFFFDVNGAYAYYRKDFTKLINVLLNNQSILLGATFVRKNKSLTITGSTDHDELKKIYEEVNWNGSNQADSVLQAIQQLRLKLTSGKKSSRKIFLLLSSSIKSKMSEFKLALNELKQMDVQTYIIVPNHSEYDFIRDLQKLGRITSSKLLGITEFQRLGFDDEYKYIYLNQFDLYSTNEEFSPPFDLSNQSFKKWDASIVRAAVDVVTSYNMAEAYEKISEKRVLEKSEVKTDIETLVGAHLYEEMNPSSNHQLVLFKTYGETLWLKVPIEKKLQVGKEYIVSTSVYLDSLSTNGFSNSEAETDFLRPNISYPKSLTILPSKAKRFMEENKIKQFSGYLQGIVTDVKKRQ
ncbi:hypothetical protein LPTSP4_28580 [Leptospira ryugenii]|uniref:Uncharacterized protein n=1 Tax=Leptospira ryugenii TaxID=1917863 RepID=A0A2P2E3C2_9LEPT|nr:hypothetical protein LPTSP4_28580 [Leptospira ryugenii]